MLHLYDKNHENKYPLYGYSDYYIDSILKNADKELSFSIPLNYENIDFLEEEAYIRNKEDEFVIKTLGINDNYVTVKANLNLEELEGKEWESFESVEQSITDCLKLAIAGTGYTIAECSITKKRTIRKSNCSALDIIEQARKTYRVELKYDTINKTISIYEQRGSDKGEFLMDTLNMKKLDVQGNTYDFYTRLIAIGSTDEEGNQLKVTVTNNDYSSKVKTLIWKDERYTVEDSLREDAQAKLDEMAKPYRSYSATPYPIPEVELGDTITIIDKDKKIREKLRIVTIRNYPEEAGKDTIEVANSILSFTDIQKDFESATETVNNITSDNATISDSAIKSAFTNLNIVNVQQLNAVSARVGTLEATSATITYVDAKVVDTEKLIADKANITDLNALTGRVKILESSSIDTTQLKSDLADIQTLVNGNLTSDNIQSMIITGDKFTVANGFIKNAMIDNLDVSKINAGTISTDKFNITSDDGGISIVGATQQFRDNNNNVRVQIGKDSSGNFTFIVKGEDGSTTLIDGTGVKAGAIADGLIIDKMVSSNANISGSKLNISSVVNRINSGTTLLKGTKIKLDEAGQTLEVAFNTLKTTTDKVKETTESNSTSITAIQGNIKTLISNTTITEDGKTVQLKDDYSELKQTVSGISSKVSTHTSNIEDLENNINNITIGGRNLQRYTNFSADLKAKWISVYSYCTKEYVADEEAILIRKTSEDTGNLGIKAIAKTCQPLVKGKQYTLSIDIKGYEGTTLLNYNYIMSNVTGVTNRFIGNLTIDDTYKRYIVTFVADKDYEEATIMLGIRNATLGQGFYFKNFKLEEGNKATTYTAAPEDVNEKLTEINNTVSTQSSSITQLQNSITLKVEKTDVDEAIKNVAIGGKNLLNYTLFDNESIDNIKKYWQTSTSKYATVSKVVYGNWGNNKGYDADLKGREYLAIITDCTGNLIQSFINPYGYIGGAQKEYIQLKPNTTYTFSMRAYLSGNSDSYNIVVWGYDDDGTNRTELTRSNKVSGYTGAFENFEFIFTTDDRKYYQLRIYHNRKSAITSGNASLCIIDPQLEEGNKRTTYSPSISDQKRFNTEYTDTKVSVVEAKITDEAFTIQIDKNKNRTYGVRYIRDFIGQADTTKGYKYASPNWMEIEVFNSKGENVAKGCKVVLQSKKTAGTDTSMVNDEMWEQGFWYTDMTGINYITLDLGSVMYDIDSIKVWHSSLKDTDYSMFNDTKTQVSVDGVNWITLFDSVVSGTYYEFASGHEVKVNNRYLNTMQGSFTEEGLKIYNGSIEVYNTLKDKVMWVDTEGMLSTNSLHVFGDGNNTVNITGKGDKAINIKSEGYGACSLNLWSTGTIGVEGGTSISVYKDDPSTLFFEAGLKPNSSGDVTGGKIIIRGVSSSTVTPRCDLHLYGKLKTLVQPVVGNPENSDSNLDILIRSSNISAITKTNATSVGDYMSFADRADETGQWGIVCWRSDERLKKNIYDTQENALEKIMKIKLKSFDFIEGDRHSKLGVIAQQIKEIDDEFAFQVNENSYMQPNPNALICYSIKAIQEQQFIIESLKKEIEELKGVTS